MSNASREEFCNQRRHHLSRGGVRRRVVVKIIKKNALAWQHYVRQFILVVTNNGASVLALSAGRGGFWSFLRTWVLALVTEFAEAQLHRQDSLTPALRHLEGYAFSSAVLSRDRWIDRRNCKRRNRLSKWQPDTCIIILKEMQRNINFSVTTTQ